MIDQEPAGPALDALVWRLIGHLGEAPCLSCPRTVVDQAALLRCVLWLAERGGCELTLTPLTDSGEPPGLPDNGNTLLSWAIGHSGLDAAALALCRAVCAVAGVSVIDEEEIYGYARAEPGPSRSRRVSG